MNKTFVKKMATLLLVLVMLCVSTGALAGSSRGNRIRYVPTTITVEANSVKVEGYFVNLNEDCDVKNFTDVKMEVYYLGDLLIDGEFGDIHQFVVNSMRTKYQSFTFNGSHDLKEGVYDCNDYYSVAFDFGFTSVE